METTNELKKSIENYYKFVVKKSEEAEAKLLIFNDHNTPSFRNFWSDFIENPKPVFIVGHEESLEHELVENSSITEFKYFIRAFREICGYVSAPFDPWLMYVEEINVKRLNDLKTKLETLFGSLKEILAKTPYGSIEQLFRDAWQYFGITSAEREEISHQRPENEKQTERNLKIQISNLFYGIIKIWLMGTYPLKVLLIDNKPERPLAEIDERFNNLLKNDANVEKVLNIFPDTVDVHIYDGKLVDFNKFFEDLQSIERKKEADILLKCRKPEKNEYTIQQLSSFDLILVDMYLGNDQPDGLEILNQLTKAFPQIPAFVLSVSDDFEVMHKASEAGADYYIIKYQVFSVPYVYYKYIENIAPLLKYINNRDYRRNLLGNIRYWKFKRNILWFGDKCYHLINHSYEHTLDDWEYTNQILTQLIKKHCKTNILQSDELLYSFCMAVWLHDIGHKGNEIYGEPHLIRDNHGYIGGNLILRYPHLFRIEDNDEYYRNLSFRDFSSIEAMYYRNREGLTITEQIALFVMYHKSNTPLDDTDYINIKKKGKMVPKEYYLNGERIIPSLISMERLLTQRNVENDKKDKMLKLMALFRFIDAIDIRTVRVGDLTEKDLKTTVIENDKNYQYLKMEREIKNLCRNTDGPLKALLIKSFYEDIKEKIERGEQIELKFPEGFSLEEIENYKLLVDYAGYIALQPTHFALHESIKKIRLKIQGNSLKIELFTDKTKKELENIQVLERGRKKQNMYERIVGADCYIKGEAEGVKHYIRNFFKNIKINLKSKREVIGQQIICLI